MFSLTQRFGQHGKTFISTSGNKISEVLVVRASYVCKSGVSRLSFVSFPAIASWLWTVWVQTCRKSVRPTEDA